MAALNKLGRLKEAKMLKYTLNKRQETDLVPSMMLAQGEYYVGNMDGAISYLEQAYDETLDYSHSIQDSLLEKLNGNPRFDAIWQKSGPA